MEARPANIESLRSTQLQYLADKYAPANPEIAETLSKLQLPAHAGSERNEDDDSSVPLPRRNSPRSQHQLALLIRDGRRAASRLASIGEASKTTESTRDVFSSISDEDKTSMSTALEQDFTVEGKKGNLQCPFHNKAAMSAQDEAPTQAEGNASQVPNSHDPSDPICAAMYEESTQSATGTGKCPIRYMDQHSAEEIAHYVETHKHELPRSHEVCLRRYQHNEHQIKKLDSKYGNLVSMVEGLGQLHQPMLPEDAERERRPSQIEKASNERVQTWAKAITVTTDPDSDNEEAVETDDTRQSHFDRPLKEVRVGESPSRPWGIHVPAYDPPPHGIEQPFSPPPAPVRMPSPMPAGAHTPSGKAPGKCPFDHTKMAAMAGDAAPTPKAEQHSRATSHRPDGSPPPFHTMRDAGSHPAKPPTTTHMAQPSFINPEAAWGSSGHKLPPQMVFTGPVFIGYPVDQAMQLMNQFRAQNP